MKIILYYGNPEAKSASDGAATFEFFDDFENTRINETKWQINYGSPSISDGVLSLSGESIVTEKVISFGYDHIFESLSKMSDTGYPLKVEIIFFDQRGKRYELKEEAFVSVAKESEMISQQQIPIINIGSIGTYVGEQVDKSTSIKDSIVQRSTFGAGARKCPDCGRKLSRIRNSVLNAERDYE